MTKVTKKFDEFISENYYEGSPTQVPGQGVSPGLFHTVGINEKDVPQKGANGEKPDPDYAPPSQNTHAEYTKGQIQLGDMVEDVNPECKFVGSFGKAFAIMGSGFDAKIDYIIANDGDNYALGEVARISAGSLKISKKHQMNG